MSSAKSCAASNTINIQNCLFEISFRAEIFPKPCSLKWKIWLCLCLKCLLSSQKDLIGLPCLWSRTAIKNFCVNQKSILYKVWKRESDWYFSIWNTKNQTKDFISQTFHLAHRSPFDLQISEHREVHHQSLKQRSSFFPSFDWKVLVVRSHIYNIDMKC